MLHVWICVLDSGAPPVAVVGTAFELNVLTASAPSWSVVPFKALLVVRSLASPAIRCDCRVCVDAGDA